MSEEKKEPPRSGGESGGQQPSSVPAAGRFRSTFFYVLLLVALLVALAGVFEPGGHKASYDEFITHLRAGHVEWVTLGDDYHRGKMEIPKGWTAPEAPERAAPPAAEREAAEDRSRPGGKLPSPGSSPFKFYVVAARDDGLIAELENAHRSFGTKFEKKPTQEFWSILSFILLPLLLLGALSYLLIRQSGQIGRTALSFGKIRAKLYAEKVPPVTFDDVAGCDEAKEELKEVIDFLKSPKKYQTLGGRMPKGILLVGPPGTGKTLLARAVAGEAKTPFFHLSGSDFVEMFVGVGASRVRDLFQQAKNRAPCIIFVDELDAVGRHRGAGLGGGHDEREQTLNQLLVEMDGFDTTQGVILLAATNRPDVLDPALLRPGRFDRQVVIDAPDAKGRRAILEVHARGKRFAKGIDFGDLAAKTPGFTGADLANAINEAALLAARRELSAIGQAELDEAIERVIAGPERKSRRLGAEERRRVAYHEAGHALVAALSKHADPVRKISIVPRGHAALGYTMQAPTDDRYLTTQSALIDKLKSLLAGRAAEHLVFGEISTGATDDLRRATEIARSMVCRFGMSDKLGPVTFGHEHHQVFLGRDFAAEDRNFSEASAEEIDHEVRRILDDASGEARKILVKHRDCLDHIAERLLEREVIQGLELEDMLERELSRKGAERPARKLERVERAEAAADV